MANNGSSLFVADLASAVVDHDLFSIFSTIGPVLSVKVCVDAHKEPLGYGYVNFQSDTDALAAIDKLNFHELKGRQMRIMVSKDRAAVAALKGANIFVKSIERSVDQKALHAYFSQFGAIESCKLVTADDGSSKGHAFVQFTDVEEASKAIAEADGKSIVEGGKPMSVAKHLTRDERAAGASDKPAHFSNVFVRGFPAHFGQHDLKKLFSSFGEVTSVYMNTSNVGGACPKKVSACVNLADGAAKAVSILDGTTVEGADEPLFVCRAVSKGEREAQARAAQAAQPAAVKNNLFIKNLAPQIASDGALEGLFSKFGKITSAKLMTDDQGVSKGFGFVCFSTAAEANEAITGMHLHVVNGKPLYVGLAEKKVERQARMATKGAGKAGAHLAGGGGGGGFPGAAGAYQAAVYGGVPMSMMAKGAGRGGYPPMYGMFPPFMQPRPGMPSGCHVPGMGMPMPQQMMAMMAAKGMAGKGGKPMMPSAVQGMTMPSVPSTRLSKEQLDGMPEPKRKAILGERLFPLVKKIREPQAGKITGMFLEMSTLDILQLLESPSALSQKVQEAVEVLHRGQ